MIAGCTVRRHSENPPTSRKAFSICSTVVELISSSVDDSFRGTRRFQALATLRLAFASDEAARHNSRRQFPQTTNERHAIPYVVFEEKRLGTAPHSGHGLSFERDISWTSC
jgi:hypothetical protein